MNEATPTPTPTQYMKRNYRFGRIRVCFIEDAHTPCMVYLSRRKEHGRGLEKLTGTLWCAADVGEIDDEPEEPEP